jgi:FKBP-type peptidyl-prolyl cis-trans isomerase
MSMTDSRIVRMRAAALIPLLIFVCAPALDAQHKIPALPPTAGKQVKTASGLRYIDIVTGTGVEAEPGRIVRIHYTAWVTKSQFMFDYRDAATGPLAFRIGGGGVLPGLDQGVRGMRVGGKRRLVIPPRLGLGSHSSQRIAPNSSLTYDVELVAVARPDA